MFKDYFKCKNCEEYFMIKTNGKEIWCVICPVCGGHHCDYATDEQINKLEEN